MKNLLIICPGLSSPYNAKHRTSYELLWEESARRGVHVDQVIYPGQMNKRGGTNGILCPIDATKAVEKRLQGIDHATDFRILGISSGCIMVIEALRMLEISVDSGTVVLWGPIPYWMYWKYFKKESPEGLGKGADFIRPYAAFFEQVIPLEIQITKAPMSNLNLRIGVGDLDSYVPLTYPDYLGSLAVTSERKWQSVESRVLARCSHNVSASNSPGYNEFLRFVFG